MPVNGLTFRNRAGTILYPSNDPPGIVELDPSSGESIVVSRQAAELIPLKNAARVSVEVDNPLIEERFVVPSVWVDADVYISLPKIKVNMYTDVTLSVKNNFGFLLQEHRLNHHNHNLHKKIADLYKVRPPDFTIVDSIVAGFGPLDLNDIELENPHLLAERRRELRRPRTDFAAFTDHVTVITGSEVCCTEGCAGMVRNSLESRASSIGRSTRYTQVSD